MILSHAQIEDIAAAAIKDFNEFFFGTENNHKRLIQATPIDQFARDYLGLEVSFAQLSVDGSICGLTAYADTEYVVEEIGATRTIPLKQNQVLLDVSLIKPGQVQALCGKRRFTLAHECAHQILFQMESDEMRLSYKKNYAASTVYSLRDLKTREDWNEWQANVLGAAILMPQNQIDLAMWYFAQSRTLTNYEGRFSYNDWLCLTHICHALGVSKAAAVIRLRQLGYIEDRPYLEYHDPLEVWA